MKTFHIGPLAGGRNKTTVWFRLGHYVVWVESVQEGHIGLAHRLRIGGYVIGARRDQ